MCAHQQPEINSPQYKIKSYLVCQMLSCCCFQKETLISGAARRGDEEDEKDGRDGRESSS